MPRDRLALDAATVTPCLSLSNAIFLFFISFPSPPPPAPSICTMSSYTRASAGSDFTRNADNSIVYYERKDPFANPPTEALQSPGDKLLEAAFFKESFAYISGHNIGVNIEGVSAGSCGLRCLATPNCKSFDYNREVGRCVLSDENRASVPDDYTTDDDDNAHSYYELLPDVDLGSVIWTLQDFSPAALSFGARTAALLGSFGDAGQRRSKRPLP